MRAGRDIVCSVSPESGFADRLSVQPASATLPDEISARAAGEKGRDVPGEGTTESKRLSIDFSSLSRAYQRLHPSAMIRCWQGRMDDVDTAVGLVDRESRSGSQPSCPSRIYFSLFALAALEARAFSVQARASLAEPRRASTSGATYRPNPLR